MATKDKDTKTAFKKIQESRQVIVNDVVKLLESCKKRCKPISESA